MAEKVTTPNELKYDSLSIIYLQVFDIKKLKDDSKTKKKKGNTDTKKYLVRKENSIDQQIFNTDTCGSNSVKRYQIQCDDKDGKCDGFEFEIEFDEKDESGKSNKINIKGRMKIEATVFFNRTVSVSYRMAIDGVNCVRTGDYLNTDHVIYLASLSQGAEHWSYDENYKEQKIKEKKSISIKSRLGKEGEWFDEPKEVQSAANDNAFSELRSRYKKFIAKQLGAELLDKTDEIEYVYVDVWEDIKYANKDFLNKKEEDIVTSIYDDHKKEMIGLMSFYAREWRYCAERNFDVVCGPNLAIDTDDIIMVNRDICVVFGTYGLRGSDDGYVDWKSHLKEMRQEYQVSWPEYMMILEMVLARRSAISSATRYLREFDEDSRSVRKSWIEDNANLNLRVANLFISLNVTDYSLCFSHKILFERTSERLEIEQKQKNLDDTMKKIDNSLESVSEMRKWNRSNSMNMLLFIISLISILSLLYQNMEMSYLVTKGVDQAQASAIGRDVLEMAFIALGLAVIWILVIIIRQRRK